MRSNGFVERTATVPFRDPTGGAAIASSQTNSSSGKGARAGCTIDFDTYRVQTAAGAEKDWHRKTSPATPLRQ